LAPLRQEQKPEPIIGYLQVDLKILVTVLSLHARRLGKSEGLAQRLLRYWAAQKEIKILNAEVRKTHIHGSTQVQQASLEGSV